MYYMSSTRGLTAIFLIRLASCCSRGSARAVKQSKQLLFIPHTAFCERQSACLPACRTSKRRRPPERSTHNYVQQENPPHVKQFGVPPLILCVRRAPPNTQQFTALLRCIAMLTRRCYVLILAPHPRVYPHPPLCSSS